MVNKLKITFLLLLFQGTMILAQNADDLIGTYHLPNNLDVEIFKVEGKFHGKIKALNGFRDGQKTDIKNDDKSKRNDSLIGKVIITNLEFDPENKRWINGKMYGPGKGMEFNLKVNEIRKEDIEVVGSKYFFWKTMNWKKI